MHNDQAEGEIMSEDVQKDVHEILLRNGETVRLGRKGEGEIVKIAKPPFYCPIEHQAARAEEERKKLAEMEKRSWADAGLINPQTKIDFSKRVVVLKHDEEIPYERLATVIVMVILFLGIIKFGEICWWFAGYFGLVGSVRI